MSRSLVTLRAEPGTNVNVTVTRSQIPFQEHMVASYKKPLLDCYKAVHQMELRSASGILRGFFTMVCVSADRAHTPTRT